MAWHTSEVQNLYVRTSEGNGGRESHGARKDAWIEFAARSELCCSVRKVGSIAAASDVTDGAPPELTSLSSVEEGEAAETEAVAMSDAKIRHHYCLR